MPFSSSAHVYDLIYQQTRDYAAQAKQVRDWIKSHNADAHTLLDVACGTGLHISQLNEWFEVSGVDVSPEMVRIAQSRNPLSTIEVGDMQNFELHRQFDSVICMFSSITYSGSIEGLHQTLDTFARHLTPGGIVIVEPYIAVSMWKDSPLGVLRVAETDELKVAFIDRAIRDGRRVKREIYYVVGSTNGLEHISEEHHFYLFTREEYEDAFRNAGLHVEFIEDGFEDGRGMYIGY